MPLALHYQPFAGPILRLALRTIMNLFLCSWIPKVCFMLNSNGAMLWIWLSVAVRFSSWVLLDLDVRIVARWPLRINSSWSSEANTVSCGYSPLQLSRLGGHLPTPSCMHSAWGLGHPRFAVWQALYYCLHWVAGRLLSVFWASCFICVGDFDISDNWDLIDLKPSTLRAYLLMPCHIHDALWHPPKLYFRKWQMASCDDTWWTGLCI